MGSWILVPCLVSLRAEFNLLAPDRDKASDGTVGDLVHAAGGTSDHLPDEDFPALRDKDPDSTNEVHAIDVDSDLNRPGWDMTRATAVIVTRHRTGLDDRLQNVIWNRRIWSRSWGWSARAYTGASPHTEHAHFSARYTAAQEQDTGPWGLLEDDMDEQSIAQAVANKLFGDLSNKESGLFKAFADRADAGFVQALGRGNAAALGKAPEGDPGQPYRFVKEALRNIVGGPVDQAAIVAAIQANRVDPAQLVAGVLAGLGPSVDPRQIAAAVVDALPALPGTQADQAKAFADELAARLAA